MVMNAIQSPDAPAAVGPYSQAIQHGQWLFLSGQIALPRTKPPGGTAPQLVADTVAEQTEQVLDNLSAVLSAAGADFSSVVKTTIYLTDLSDFAQVNEIYGRRVGTPPPARATIQVAALPLGAKVEIDAIAVVTPPSK